MKFSFKNIRPIESGCIDINKLTILCGKNNTGKTYITNIIYSFLDTWYDHIEWELPEDIVKKLYKDGAIKVDLEELVANNFTEIRAGIVESFSRKLPEYLACSKAILDRAEIDFLCNIDSGWKERQVSSELKNFENKNFLIVKKPKDSKYAEILLQKTTDDFPHFILTSVLSKILVKMVVINIPSTFIASAERTGAAIFKNELNFGRNQLISYLSEMPADSSDHINPFDLISKFKRNYAHSVVKNVEFISNLSGLEAKGKSEFIKKNPHLIEDFIGIAGGEYKSSEKGGIFFQPLTSKEPLELGIGESSSTVRALMLIWYWLNYVAETESLLIIDEPELNLHPANQRKLARFLVSLTNSGVKVFITTHSDYIIREINTLILLNIDAEHVKVVKENFGYRNNEVISIDDINIYVANKDDNSHECDIKIEKVEVTLDKGIVIQSFDNEIQKINDIQNTLLYGF